MAKKVSNGNGDLDSATIWDSVTNTPTIHASTNATIGTSYTATFTAPNTTNACTGALLYLVAKSTASTITLTLQENLGDTAATVTVNVSAMTAGAWHYFRFATPYVFTATTAGYYRFKVTRDAGSPTMAADSGGTLVAYIATDDQVGALGATDDIYIAHTVAVAGDQSIGSGAYTTLFLARSLGNAVNIVAGGTLQWDQTQSSNLSVTGHIVVYGGTLRMDDQVGGAMAADYIAKITFVPGSSGDFGLLIIDGGKAELHGQPKTSTSLWKTHYVSGTGATGSELTTEDEVAWAVNDEIVVCASSDNAANYDESEFKFIKTAPSTTTFTLSDTAGGGEAALTYTHNSDAWILNLTRNVWITTNNVAKAWYFANYNTTLGNVDLDWVRFENNSLSSTQVTYIENGASVRIEWDYCVHYRKIGSYNVSLISSSITETFTGNIFCNGNNISGAEVNISTKNKTFSWFFVVHTYRTSILCGSPRNTYDHCIVIGANRGGSTSGSGGINTNYNNNYNYCEIHCSRFGVYSTAFGYIGKFSDCEFGTKGTNKLGGDVNVGSDTTFQVDFDNCLFGSTTLVYNYLNALTGLQIRFNDYQQVVNQHLWYTNTGAAYSTGSGLGDTTVRTADSLALKLAPENATDGFIWEFKILAKATSAVSALGFIKKNATFGTDDIVIELFLPGSTVADDTWNAPDDENWNVFILAASYAGSVDLYATVRVTAKSAAAGAYCYIDDIYNGTNKITALDVWDNGMPSPIMFEQLGDAAAVWAVLASTQTAAGTMGKLVVDTGIGVDDAAILALAG